MCRRCARRSPPTRERAPRKRVERSATHDRKGRTIAVERVPASTAPRWGCPAVSRQERGHRPTPFKSKAARDGKGRERIGPPPHRSERRRAARSSQAASETDSRRAASPRAGRASVPGPQRGAPRGRPALGARSALRLQVARRRARAARRLPRSRNVGRPDKRTGKVAAEGRSRREPVPAAKARRPAAARAGRPKIVRRETAPSRSSSLSAAPAGYLGRTRGPPRTGEGWDKGFTRQAPSPWGEAPSSGGLAASPGQSPGGEGLST